MAVKKELSLLPDSENPRSFGAKLLKWLTSTGRVTIIVTEFVVVSVFISRFWLDRKNSDLGEIVRQRQAILETTSQFESEFTNLQKRLSYIKTFYQNQPDYSYQLNSLVSSTPQDLFFQNITISPDEKAKETSVKTTLIAYKEESIVSFITNLMLNPDLSLVNIDRIEKKEKSNQYFITLNIIFKPATTKAKT